MARTMRTSSQRKNLKLIKKPNKPADNKRLNCLTNTPILCTGLNVKGNDEITIINFLDGINNISSSNLITSIALPPSVVKDLYKSLGQVINQQENE